MLQNAYDAVQWYVCSGCLPIGQQLYCRYLVAIRGILRLQDNSQEALNASKIPTLTRDYTAGNSSI